MNSEIRTFKDGVAVVLRAWRQAIPFFVSIELWLMVLAAAATVGGVWLAFLGDAGSLLAFAFALGYPVARTVLHVKRILHWPFI